MDREFRVDRVTFVHKDKLPRIRRRLSLAAPVSEIKKSSRRRREFFESAETFAVVRQEGSRDEVAQWCLELVREEAAILSLSQLGYSNRSHMRPIVPAGEVVHPYLEYLGVDDRDAAHRFASSVRTAPVGQVALTDRWKGSPAAALLTNLVKILRGETEVETTWRKELRRASVMAGESVAANDLLKSFVWNMVVLEMLLTKRDDTVRETLPRRAEALLGWVFFWEAEDYEDRIREVYRKRNGLLHSGKRDNITERDLAFTDHLLLNLLLNLVGNPGLFGSKDDVVRFSERLEAERVLNLTPRVRPKNLRFVRRVKPDF